MAGDRGLGQESRARALDAVKVITRPILALISLRNMYIGFGAVAAQYYMWLSGVPLYHTATTGSIAVGLITTVPRASPFPLRPPPPISSVLPGGKSSSRAGRTHASHRLFAARRKARHNLRNCETIVSKMRKTRTGSGGATVGWRGRMWKRHNRTGNKRRLGSGGTMGASADSSCRLRIWPLSSRPEPPRCHLISIFSFSPIHVLVPFPPMMGPPHPLASRQARLSCSSTATHSGSTDSRKGSHRKENQFLYRAGSKLHAYDRDKAPYPMSFDRNVVEMYVKLSFAYSLATM